MTVRPAKFSDILSLCKLAEEMHSRSVYAERCTLDRERFKKVCINSIRTHGKASCLYVFEDKGRVTGFIIGVLDRVYGIAKEFYATDLFFFVSEEASGRAAPALLDAFTKWGERQPKVVEVFVGVSGAIGDWQRTVKMYERKGFRLDGAMLTREVGNE